MNWDAIGAIGEIIWAAAVIITLGYLAIQIRQGTDLARTQYHTNSVQNLKSYQHWKAANSDNARIFREGMMDFRLLGPDERVMFDGVLDDFILSFKDVLEAYERGFMDRETYGAWEGYVGSHLAMPGALKWWEHARIGFIEKLQRTINSAIEKTPPYHELVPIVFENEP